MKKVRIGKKNLEIYDSIDELPIKRFHKFNKYMLVDAGIGSDIGDINEHILKVARYIDKGDKPNAKKQLENLRQAMFMVSQETNIKHLSFITLIKSINGKDIHDLSDDNIRKLSQELNEASKTFLDRLIESVKKKIDSELNLYFPGHFEDASTKEYFDNVKRRALLQIDMILRGRDNTDKIDQIDDFLLSLSKPQVFSGKDSAEIQYDKQFDEMCLFLKKELQVEIDDMSVLQFYNAFEYLKKINKPKPGSRNGRKSNKVQ